MTVNVNKRKWLIRLSQMAQEVGVASLGWALVINKLPGPKKAPNPVRSTMRNVETQYCSRPGGTAHREVSLWRCWIGMSEKANVVL